jgi:hypothetical protein
MVTLAPSLQWPCMHARTQVPAAVGGRAVPGGGDGVHGGAGALLLPLDHAHGAGGLLPPPARGGRGALFASRRPHNKSLGTINTS